MYLGFTPVLYIFHHDAVGHLKRLRPRSEHTHTSQAVTFTSKSGSISKMVLVNNWPLTGCDMWPI